MQMQYQDPFLHNTNNSAIHANTVTGTTSVVRFARCAHRTSTRYTTPHELGVAMQSHAILWRLRHGAHVAQSALHSRNRGETKRVAPEEVVFLDFRSAWLVPQRRVYAALPLHTCHVCMYDYYAEALQKQHDARHPAVCHRCFSRLRYCPFCRVPLFPHAPFAPARQRYTSLSVQAYDTEAVVHL
jgi:hypothetical protein